MPDSFTTTTEHSWFSRIGDALKGIVIGGILTAIAFLVLFLNEGRAVKTYRALKEGAGATVSAQASVIAPEHEGKPVHVTGRASSAESLTDDAFGVTAPNALSLVRTVEMYQWREKSESKTDKQLGGSATTTTTTVYEKVWCENAIDSTGFKQPEGHANPGAFPFASETHLATAATLGVRTLRPQQIARIPATAALPPAAVEALKVPEALKARAAAAPAFTYFGKSFTAPEIGDLRVSLKVAGPTDISVIAAQKGAGFAPYTTENGRTIDLLKVGTFTAAQMFEQAQAENTALTWVLRFVGFALMTGGIALVLRPLSVLADVVPLLGDMVGIGVTLIAVALGGGLSLTTIAVAWLAYRPLLAIALLLVVAAVAYAVHRRRVARQAAAKPASAPAAA